MPIQRLRQNEGKFADLRHDETCDEGIVPRLAQEMKDADICCRFRDENDEDEEKHYPDIFENEGKVDQQADR